MAGEEIRRWWPTGLCPPAGPEQSDQSPRLSLPPTLLPQPRCSWALSAYLLEAQYLARGWLSLGLQVGGDWGPQYSEERPRIHLPLPFSREKEVTFKSSFSSVPASSVGPSPEARPLRPSPS